MISESLIVRAFPSSKSVPVYPLSDLESVVADSETEWILIATERASDREISPPGSTLQQLDVVWCGSDPLLGWFWSHASPYLAACLGITAPLLVRTSLVKILLSQKICLAIRLC